MLDIFDVIVLGGVICSFVTSLVLFTQNRYQLHANRLLSIILFSSGWYGFMYILLQTRGLESVPLLFRLGSPLYYLIPPCAYLYVRGIIMDETRFRKRDWLHFLPALIHVAELIPFYFSDMETKRQAVSAVMTNFTTGFEKGSGLLPSLSHFIFRPLQGIIYMTISWRLLAHSLRKENYYNIAADEFTRIKRWLFFFTGFVSFLYLGLSVRTIMGLLALQEGKPVILGAGPMHVIMACSFFVHSIYLFFKPDILYGTLKTEAAQPGAQTSDAPATLETILPAMAQPVPAAAEPTLAPKPVSAPLPVPLESRDTLLNEEQVLIHARKIEEHLVTNQSFRKRGITITQLAVELTMPMHHLSYVLNYHYKQRFTDFINQYRVTYVRQLLKEGGWQKLKLESLAMEAGFSARSTFFSAFKKMTGVTPIEYARQAMGLEIPEEQPD
ncbi:MAG: AraC family transcriptional regulator [Chitinophagaceae bacterium]